MKIKKNGTQSRMKTGDGLDRNPDILMIEVSRY